MTLTLVLILGSVRAARLSSIAAAALAKTLRTRGHTVHIVDPAVTPLPMLERPYHQHADAAGTRPTILTEIGAVLQSADAYVTICGEYNHGVPPALLNTLDHFPRSMFNAKPVGIFTYSSGPWGGRMAAAQLRTILPELGMFSIPTLLSIADATPDTFSTQLFTLSPFVAELEFYANALREAAAAKRTSRIASYVDTNTVE